MFCHVEPLSFRAEVDSPLKRGFCLAATMAATFSSKEFVTAFLSELVEKAEIAAVFLFFSITVISA